MVLFLGPSTRGGSKGDMNQGEEEEKREEKEREKKKDKVDKPHLVF